MPRPDFPRPYSSLPAQVISRIVADQEYYDRDPEKAEREQAARQAAREEELRAEYEAYLQEETAQQRLQSDDSPDPVSSDNSSDDDIPF